jgi:transposase
VSTISGLDVHRAQITYDWIDTDTGQTRQGQLALASREHLRGWLERFAGQQAAFAWRAVPAGGMSLRNSGWPGSPRTWPSRPTPARCGGHKRHAKTDRADARHLRDLLMGGRLPESWIPPAHVLEARTQVRLHKALVDQRTAWQQRIHADCSATACRPSPICWSPSAASA